MEKMALRHILWCRFCQWGLFTSEWQVLQSCQAWRPNVNLLQAWRRFQVRSCLPKLQRPTLPALVLAAGKDLSRSRPSLNAGFLPHAQRNKVASILIYPADAMEPSPPPTLVPGTKRVGSWDHHTFLLRDICTPCRTAVSRSWLSGALQVPPSVPVHQQDWGEAGGKFDRKDCGLRWGQRDPLPTTVVGKTDFAWGN